MLTSFKTSCIISDRKKLYTAQDIVAITLCSTHKSLTLGRYQFTFFFYNDSIVFIIYINILFRYATFENSIQWILAFISNKSPSSHLSSSATYSWRVFSPSCTEMAEKEWKAVEVNQMGFCLYNDLLELTD